MLRLLSLLKGNINMTKDKARLQKIYPWIVVAVCFLMVMVCLGFGSYSRSTYLKVVTEQMGLERGAFSLSDTIRNLVTAILSIYFGKLLFRFEARKMIAGGFAALTVSFVFNAVARGYLEFYIGGVFLGIGLAWTTTTIVGVLVERWFSGNTGTIMGVILAANGVGGFISEKVVNRIIFGMDLSRPISEGNWRGAYWFVAVLFAVVGVIVVLLLRNKPEDLGIEKTSIAEKKKRIKRVETWEGITLKQAIHKPYFYMAVFSVFFNGIILQAMVTLAKPLMQDVGIGMNVIDAGFSIYAFLLVGTKVLTGLLYDKWGLKAVYSICSAGSLIAVILLLFQSPERTYFTYAYQFFAPIGLPLETVMIPLFTKGLFGLKDFTKTMGYFVAINTLGMAVGTSASNLVYDLIKTYVPCLQALIVMFILSSFVGIVAINLSQKERKKEDAPL